VKGPFNNDHIPRMFDKHHQPLIVRRLGSQKGKPSGIVSEIKGVLDYVKPKGFLIQ
jgi:hypothetical protein